MMFFTMLLVKSCEWVAPHGGCLRCPSPCPVGLIPHVRTGASCARSPQPWAGGAKGEDDRGGGGVSGQGPAPGCRGWTIRGTLGSGSLSLAGRGRGWCNWRRGWHHVNMTERRDCAPAGPRRTGRWLRSHRAGWAEERHSSVRGKQKKEHEMAVLGRLYSLGKMNRNGEVLPGWALCTSRNEQQWL